MYKKNIVKILFFISVLSLVGCSNKQTQNSIKETIIDYSNSEQLKKDTIQEQDISIQNTVLDITNNLIFPDLKQASLEDISSLYGINKDIFDEYYVAYYDNETTENEYSTDIIPGYINNPLDIYKPYEIAIFKSKDTDNLNIIKNSFEKRLNYLKENNPDIKDFINNGKIFINNDYIMLVICDNPDYANNAFLRTFDYSIQPLEVINKYEFIQGNIVAIRYNNEKSQNSIAVDIEFNVDKGNVDEIPLYNITLNIDEDTILKNVENFDEFEINDFVKAYFNENDFFDKTQNNTEKNIFMLEKYQ